MDQIPASSTSANPIGLDKEVVQFNQFTRQTYDLVQKQRTTLPPEVVNHLNQMSSSLTRLGQQVKQGKSQPLEVYEVLGKT